MPGSESGPRQPKLKGQKGSAERQQGPGTGTKPSAGSALKQPAQSGPSPNGRRAGQPGLSGQKAGQQASLKSQPDPASRQGLKQALAPAKSAADGRVAKAQDGMKAEESIAGWRAQVQGTEIASNEPPAPIQPATGQPLSLPLPNVWIPLTCTLLCLAMHSSSVKLLLLALKTSCPGAGPAHNAEDASRQKGSDASSLEHSPDIPHPGQQQQRVDAAEGQGEAWAMCPRQLSFGRHGMCSIQHLCVWHEIYKPLPSTSLTYVADEWHVPGVEDREHDALADSKAVTAHSQPLQLAPVEYLGEGLCASQQLGQIDLNQFDSYR